MTPREASLPAFRTTNVSDTGSVAPTALGPAPVTLTSEREPTSTAPASHEAPWGRGPPRASVLSTPQAAPVSIAGLPASGTSTGGSTPPADWSGVILGPPTPYVRGVASAPSRQGVGAPPNTLPGPRMTAGGLSVAQASLVSPASVNETAAVPPPVRAMAAAAFPSTVAPRTIRLPPVVANTP